MTIVTLLKNLIWGNQLIYKGVVNKDEWAFGNKLSVNTWIQKELSHQISISARLSADYIEKINGVSSSISGPVQTANPENYGGRLLNGAIGINLLSTIFGASGKDRFALEFIFPLDQDKNGVQMKTRNAIIFGYQRSF